MKKRHWANHLDRKGLIRYSRDYINMWLRNFCEIYKLGREKVYEVFGTIKEAEERIENYQEPLREVNQNHDYYKTEFPDAIIVEQQKKNERKTTNEELVYCNYL